jgi:uncharacterized protein (TIGR02217 family)
MSSLHAVRLPVDIEKGTQGGLGFYTTITASPPGGEQRNQQWEDERGSWDISYGIRKDVHLRAVRNFYFARRGKAFSFLFRDWGDYTATDTGIGVGNGVVDDIGFTGHRAGTADWQLVKTYPDNVNPFVRRIFQPDLSAPYHIYVNAVEKTVTQVANGVFRFLNADIPLVGEVITGTFTFDIAVRFDSDRLAQVLSTPDVYSISSIKLVGVMPPAY